MRKYINLLLFSALLIGSCKKDPKVVPNEPTEPETEVEADPVMFARKDYDGEYFLSVQCRDGNIVGISTEQSEGTLRKVSGTDEHLLGIWDNGTGYLLLGVSSEGNSTYNSFLMGMSSEL